jgi:pimeloyl-ACP methyl ester carboxylesterase
MASTNLPARLHKYENDASRYVVVDGMRVHYRDEGLRDGPALVLLHGVMASLHTWDGWVEALKAHYRIVRIDLPGFGFSDGIPDGDYTPQQGAARIDKLADALGLGRFHMAGNSLGGLLTWYYAASFPNRVQRLVLVSPIAYQQKLPFIIDAVSRTGIGGIAGKIRTPKFLIEQNVRMVYGDPTSPSADVIDRYWDLLQYGKNRETMVKTFRALRAYNVDDSIAERVVHVKAPTLVMWGTKDRWVPPTLAERWKKDLPGATVRMYPGLGHVAMEEEPAMTAREAHAFLSAGAADRVQDSVA